jgi:putative transposase
MTYRLRRYYGNRHLHYITCSCYHRQAWLGSPRRRDQFLKVLQEVRQLYQFVVVGYVVMPEHFHLLISEPATGTPSTVMRVLKQRFAHQVLKQLRQRRDSAQTRLWAEKQEHVWQRRFYDFNVWTEHKRIEKLRYMHRNPVERRLVLAPEQWAWSSFRWYAMGEIGVVKINEPEAAELKIKTAA